MGWLSGWNYRKSHVIGSASGAGTNYQIRIKVYYGSGTDSGENVYLNGKCRTDFGDVRFTDNDGETLLDYWMETKVDGDYAVFWVEVADDLSSNSATIYVYYGKGDATTTSNGDATFIFFDDFSSWDSNKWTVRGGSPTVENGELKLPAGASVKTVSNYSALCRQRLKVRFTGNLPGFGIHMYVHAFNWDNSSNRAAYMWIDHSTYKWRLYYKDTYTQNLGTYKATLGSYIFDAKTTATKERIDITGYLTDYAQVTYTEWTNPPTAGFSIHGAGANTTAYVDWVFLSKYVDPEPAHGIWGSEETPSGGQTYEISVNTVCQSLYTSSHETAYNISKDAAITSRSLHTQENTYNLAKDAFVNVLADVLVEVATGVMEIFKEAITAAQVLCQTETAFNIGQDALAQALTQTLFELNLAKDAVVKVSATNAFEVTFTLPLSATVKAEALSILESTFNISPEATIKVLAEVAIIKPTEVKITRLFLVIGDLAIQIQGN